MLDTYTENDSSPIEDMNSFEFIVYQEPEIAADIQVIKYPRKIAPWCSLSIATMGTVLFGGFALPYSMPGGPSCRVLLYAMAIASTIMSMAISIILLECAYLAHCRNRYLLVIGLLLVLLESLLFYVLTKLTYGRISLDRGCHFHFAYYVPIVQFVLVAPVNLLLSVAFLIVVYRKYRRYGEQCWKILVREGILTILFILGSGFLYMMCNIFRVFSGSTIILYAVEYVLISTIIVESLRRLDAYMGHHTSADQQPNMRKPHKSSQLNSLLATNYYTDAPTTF